MAAAELGLVPTPPEKGAGTTMIRRKEEFSLTIARRSRRFRFARSSAEDVGEDPKNLNVR
jgi:hypothetical protein